ncbi:hypothetical protein WJX81_002350 [Elliptochloris bilobata]|uniref:Leucine-rich repeat-containing N-terminal plant-type domain-containing protein n=1 Tax=Elliptochloris bilobata TaxID=381761 RepID=A0AAW1R384_9CHLO
MRHREWAPAGAHMRPPGAAWQPWGGQAGGDAQAGSPSDSPELDTEARTMAALRQGFGNLGQLRARGLQGWTSGTHPCDDWAGVTCDAAGRVIALELGGWGISGRLLPELVGLTALQRLNLSANNLQGGLPSNWARTGVFPDLTVLDLSSNPRLNGVVIAQWGTQGAFASLQEMNLSHSGLSGQLPLAWGGQLSLPALRTLDLSGNGLQGTVPASWSTPGSMTRLAALHLGSNALTGSLPPEWGIRPTSLPRLAVLGLARNNLTGTLPDVWGTGFPALREVQLQGNQLQGVLPGEWGVRGRWRALELLQLQGNALQGPAPAAWGGAGVLPSLSYLMLRPGNPGLCGALPSGLAAPAASAPPPAPAFVPPQNSSNAYLQVQYQLSGRDLGGRNSSASDPEVRQRVTSAFQRTLGPGVNATLLDLKQSQQIGDARRLRRLMQAPAAGPAAAPTWQAVFLITAKPVDLLTITQNVHARTLPGKFEQELAASGLPNTRAVPAGVNSVQHDGTLAPVSDTLIPPAAAPGGAPPPAGVVGAMPGLHVAAVDGGTNPPGQGSGGGTAALVGGVLGAAIALAFAGAVAWLYMRKRARTAATDSEKPLKPGAAARAGSVQGASVRKDGDRGAAATAAVTAGEGGKGTKGEGAEAGDPVPDPDLKQVTVDPSAVEALLAAVRADAAQALARKQAAQPQDAHALGPPASSRPDSVLTISEIEPAPAEDAAAAAARAAKGKGVMRGVISKASRTDSANSLRLAASDGGSPAAGYGAAAGGAACSSGAGSSSDRGGSALTSASPGSTTDSLSGSESGRKPAAVVTMRSSAAAAVQQRVLAAEAALHGGRAAHMPRPGGARAVLLPAAAGSGFAPAGPLRAGSLSSPRAQPRQPNPLVQIAMQLREMEAAAAARSGAAHGSAGSLANLARSASAANIAWQSREATLRELEAQLGLVRAGLESGRTAQLEGLGREELGKLTSLLESMEREQGSERGPRRVRLPEQPLAQTRRPPSRSATPPAP